MRVTIKDVARQAGVSTSTVSLVLNNKPVSISQETRNAVLAAARELNYRPNQLAVSLVTQKSKTLGLIIPDNSNLFFAQLSKHIETAVNAAGYTLIYGNSNDSVRTDLHYLHIFGDRGVDGIIISPSAFGTPDEYWSCLSFIYSLKLPVVFIDRSMEESNLPSVLPDNFTGGYIATRHLLDQGHRVIGCCTGPANLNSSEQRLNGYRKALDEYGIPFNPTLIYQGDFSTESGQKALPYLLGQNVTAVFAFNDMMAFGIYKEMHSYNLSIPGDLSIVGFDDIFFAELIQPPLTTVAQPIAEMAAEVVKTLVSQIETPSREINAVPKTFSPVLKVRGSVRKIDTKQNNGGTQ